MRLTTVLVSLALLAVLGCTASVGNQLLVERDAFNATLIGVHTAHVTGVLPATQEAKILPILKSVQAALDAGDAAFKVGNTSQASVYLQAVSAGLQQLAAVYPGPAAVTAAK